MATVEDVADYILAARGPMSAMKLQKLLYHGHPEALTADERETVDRVLAFYGDKDPQWLCDLTHLEAPWREARRGIPDGERGSAIIGKAAIAEYYGSLR